MVKVVRVLLTHTGDSLDFFADVGISSDFMKRVNANPGSPTQWELVGLTPMGRVPITVLSYIVDGNSLTLRGIIYQPYHELYMLELKPEPRFGQYGKALSVYFR